MEDVHDCGDNARSRYFMGLYLRYWRPGKVLECSAIGFLLVLVAVFGGQWIAGSSYAPLFTLSAMALAIAIIIYGFLASALPVWLLLAPRDYLSTFVKLGVISMLAIGIFVVRPDLQMPAFSRFVDGTGPVLAGKCFPFCFITIACGAVSGFHALISSGSTPKMIIEKKLHATPDRLRIDAARKFRCHHGDDCRLFAGSRRLLFRKFLRPALWAGLADAAVKTITGWGFPVNCAADGGYGASRWAK